MHDVMSRVFWRSAKKHVSGEINLPPQTNQITWLQFSPVEDHFYRRQSHLAITDASKSAVFRQRQAEADTTHLSSLDRYTLNTLLAPLLRLRQACCHPQIVRGEMVSFGRSTKTNMSMVSNNLLNLVLALMCLLVVNFPPPPPPSRPESHFPPSYPQFHPSTFQLSHSRLLILPPLPLPPPPPPIIGSSSFICLISLIVLIDSIPRQEQLLTEMINISSKEATDTHRQLIASMNGLAGVHILTEDYPAAVEEYREVIRSVEFHADRLHTDSLQQLHTYHNLTWILTRVKPEGVDPTLRDDKLREQVFGREALHW